MGCSPLEDPRSGGLESAPHITFAAIAPPSGPALPFEPAATWRSGYAAACKAVYTGSIPVVAFPMIRGHSTGQ